MALDAPNIEVHRWYNLLVVLGKALDAQALTFFTKLLSNSNWKINREFMGEQMIFFNELS